MFLTSFILIRWFLSEKIGIFKLRKTILDKLLPPYITHLLNSPSKEFVYLPFYRNDGQPQRWTIKNQVLYAPEPFLKVWRCAVVKHWWLIQVSENLVDLTIWVTVYVADDRVSETGTNELRRSYNSINSCFHLLLKMSSQECWNLPLLHRSNTK